MGEYLSFEEAQNLIIRVKSGDNEAWESLYYDFEKYVHKCAWNQCAELGFERMEIQKEIRT